MKIYRKELSNCTECPNCSIQEGIYIDGTDASTYLCIKTRKFVKDLKTFPEWCPLEDKE